MGGYERGGEERVCRQYQGRGQQEAGLQVLSLIGKRETVVVSGGTTVCARLQLLAVSAIKVVIRCLSDM